MPSLLTDDSCMLALRTGPAYFFVRTSRPPASNQSYNLPEPVADTPIPETFYRQSENRISLLTLVLGTLVAIPVAVFHSGPWGLGILIGAALAWLNFRWLQQGLDALTSAATAQSGNEKVHVPVASYGKTLFRYGLIALIVYVIFRYLHVPALSMICGLCALGAATVLVSVHSILRSTD
jgi:ATP synthase I chain